MTGILIRRGHPDTQGWHHVITEAGTGVVLSQAKAAKDGWETQEPGRGKASFFPASLGVEHGPVAP